MNCSALSNYKLNAANIYSGFLFHKTCIFIMLTTSTLILNFRMYP